MGAAISDDAVAQFVRQFNFATAAQLESAREFQASCAREGPPVTLADALVRLGVITLSQRETVEQRIRDQQAGSVQQLAHYRLLKKVGEGGMGVVYLAEDTLNAQRVALKVLARKHTGSPKVVHRFQREANEACRLNHVNIVRAFAFGEDKGWYFYVMEFCEGETLDKRLHRDKGIPAEEATGIVIQAARGLKYAHDMGVIHRDVKPSNLFLAPGGIVKILDLGLSKNLDEVDASFMTQAGVAIGTPHYMSPEQARGDRQVDSRTDVYSLGATFYHLVTGDTPFHGPTAFDVIAKHVNAQLPDPRDIREEVPDGVAHVIRKMMAKRPEDRYPEMGALLDDLERVSAGLDPKSHAIEGVLSSVAKPAVPRPPRRYGAPPPRAVVRQEADVDSTTQAPVVRPEPPRATASPGAPARPDASARPGPPRAPAARPDAAMRPAPARPAREPDLETAKKAAGILLRVLMPIVKAAGRFAWAAVVGVARVVAWLFRRFGPGAFHAMQWLSRNGWRAVRATARFAWRYGPRAAVGLVRIAAAVVRFLFLTAVAIGSRLVTHRVPIAGSAVLALPALIVAATLLIPRVATRRVSASALVNSGAAKNLAGVDVAIRRYKAVERKITVDGEIADWEGVQAAAVRGLDRVYAGPGAPQPKRWGGEADLGFSWRAAWSGNRLFFLFEVTDDKPLDPSRPKTGQNDGVELYLDCRNRGGPMAEMTIDGDRVWRGGHRLQFLAASPCPVYIKDQFDREKPGTEVFMKEWSGEVVVKKRSDGYTMEIAFEIPGETLDPDRSMGFEAAVTDDDGEGRKTIMTWTESREPFWLSMDDYGKLVLVRGKP